MAVHNAEIANTFDTLADLLAIEGANPFRVRAYREAARVVRGHSKNVADMVEQGEDLSALPNVGKDLAGKIKTVVETGKLPLLEKVQSRTPATLTELMEIDTLGPKRVEALYEQLDISSIADLKKAAEKGEIRRLKGFGQRTEQKIRQELERFTGESSRTLLVEAEQVAEPLAEYLRKRDGVKEIVIAGSYRRRKETVGDLDILATAKRGSSVMDDFVSYGEVEEVISHGKTRSTVRVRSGLHVDLRVVPQVSYGAALHYFTGSKAHNIAVRKRGLGKGYKINEYGVFKGDKRIAGRTEEEVYAKVDLPYILPELREERGELDAAKAGKLPELITAKDIRGDLHCHTNATDGRNTLEEMVGAARDLGYDYLSINDHTQHLTVAKGFNKKRLLEQIKAIDRLNEKLDGIRILRSTEVDILEDGSLDLPDSVLKELDFTVCSVHYKLHLSRKKQTERILRAMDNRYFNILAHPSGRLIGEREPSELDLERIMEAAAERGCILEVNAQPKRLDLTDAHCKMAKELGLKLVISTDAHSTADLDRMRLGVYQARRGWLEAGDVINTRTLSALRKLFAR